MTTAAAKSRRLIGGTTFSSAIHGEQRFLRTGVTTWAYPEADPDKRPFTIN
jgi:hypothetical protein